MCTHLCDLHFVYVFSADTILSIFLYINSLVIMYHHLHFITDVFILSMYIILVIFIDSYFCKE